MYVAGEVRHPVFTALRGTEAVLAVEDNGPGFPPDEIRYVFEKFYRLKRSKAGGTGLGLSIVKGFTEAQGGHIELENCSEGGAKFTLSLPAETSYRQTAIELETMDYLVEGAIGQ